nr:MAG TPA: hypothetical protein [Caudoviricetes sp.]
MKEYKLNVYNALCETAKSCREIHFYDVCCSIGVKHLKTQEVLEIMNKFIHSNPSYRAVQFIDPKRPAAAQSLFTTLVLTECE